MTSSYTPSNPCLPPTPPCLVLLFTESLANVEEIAIGIGPILQAYCVYYDTQVT